MIILPLGYWLWILFIIGVLWFVDTLCDYDEWHLWEINRYAYIKRSVKRSYMSGGYDRGSSYGRLFMSNLYEKSSSYAYVKWTVKRLYKSGCYEYEILMGVYLWVIFMRNWVGRLM